MVKSEQQKKFELIVANYQKRAIEQGLLELGCLEASEPIPDLPAPDVNLNDISRSTTVDSISSLGSIISAVASTSHELSAERFDKRIYQVQFKHSFRHCSNITGRALSVGDFVILDFSHDQIGLGVVTFQYTWEQFEAKRIKAGKFIDEDESKVFEIIRLATPVELTYLPIKHEQEQRILKICQHLATDVFCLSMNIYGVEFQFDGKKVSVFYTSGTRVDYKNLVKEVYKHCKIHVWMRKTNQCSKFNPMLFAAMALMTGVPHH